MRSRRSSSTLLTVRAPLVWLIALAILAYGHSATMVHLLGPTHRHEAAPTLAASGLLHRIGHLANDIRAWHDEVNERLMPSAWRAHGFVHPHDRRQEAQAGGVHSLGHAHTHATYERHHHDPQDGSVMALDDSHDDAASDASGQGGPMLLLALAPRWNWSALQGLAGGWTAHPSSRWTDAALLQPERPPQA